MSNDNRSALWRRAQTRHRVLSRPHRVWGLVFLIAGCGLILTGVFPAIGRWLAQDARIHPADAIVILGGNMERLHRGIQLYHQGLAPELWHTGATPETASEHSFAQFAAQRAVQEGVPSAAVHLVQTESTWQDGQQIVVYAKHRQIQSLLIVTDWYHSRRALCVIRSQTERAGIKVHYAPATETAYSPQNWWNKPAGWKAVVSEVLKIGYYGLRYQVYPWTCPT